MRSLALGERILTLDYESGRELRLSAARVVRSMAQARGLYWRDIRRGALDITSLDVTPTEAEISDAMSRALASRKLDGVLQGQSICMHGRGAINILYSEEHEMHLDSFALQ